MIKLFFAVPPLDFTDDEIMSLFCSTAASLCQFPFTWNGTEYTSCTKVIVRKENRT